MLKARPSSKKRFSFINYTSCSFRSEGSWQSGERSEDEKVELESALSWIAGEQQAQRTSRALALAVTLRIGRTALRTRRGRSIRPRATLLSLYQSVCRRRGAMFTPLEKVGVVCLAIVGFQVTRSVLSRLYYSLLAPALNLNVNLKEMGKWAVITGATDGLGKAFAEELASKGMDVVLISRTKSKLDAVAQEIRDNYKVNTKVVEADFTEGNTVYHHIEKELYGMEVGVLINNVGLSYPHPDLFLSLPEHSKVYHDIIQCNIAAMLSMCQIVMPGMCEQRRGVVINISSTAGNIPSPMLSVYGASKIFVSKFSKDLASEYKKFGIVIQCLLPGYVATKMSKIKKPTWMAPSPRNYVRSALRTVGIEDQTTGYYPHSLLVGCIKLMESLSPSFAYWMITRTMENIKSRAIKKKNTAES